MEYETIFVLHRSKLACKVEVVVKDGMGSRMGV